MVFWAADVISLIQSLSGSGALALSGMTGTGAGVVADLASSQSQKRNTNLRGTISARLAAEARTVGTLNLTVACAFACFDHVPTFWLLFSNINQQEAAHASPATGHYRYEYRPPPSPCLPRPPTFFKCNLESQHYSLEASAATSFVRSRSILMCLCVYIYMYTYSLSFYICIYMCMYVFTCMYIHIYVLCVHIIYIYIYISTSHL